MTELERYQPRDVVDGWVQMLPAVGDLAVKIASTEFVPTQLRGKPAAVAAAILSGRELGLAPLQSLQHVAIVQGRPSLSAEMCRALVVAAGHEIFFPERTTTRCVIRGRRRGQQEWTEVTFSMDDARRAKLDGKDNWRHYPRRMLDARATSELCHLIFPDVVGGIAVTEEALDEGDRPTIAEGEVVERPPVRTAQRRTPPKSRPAADAAPPPPADPTPVEGPPLPGEPGYETDEVAPAEPVAEPAAEPTPAQLRKLGAVYTSHGVTDRDERLTITGQIVARPVSSAKDLTRAEAGTVIDTLERLAASGQDFGTWLAQLFAANDPEQQQDQPLFDDDQADEGHLQ